MSVGNRSLSGTGIVRWSMVVIVGSLAPPAPRAWAQPLTEWSDDFTLVTTYDSMSLLAPCYGGPPTKYTVIEPYLGDIFNEQAVSGGGNLKVSNFMAGLPGWDRLELTIVGWLGLGVGCFGEPPFLQSDHIFDDNSVTVYAGFEFVKAADLSGDYTYGAAMRMNLLNADWVYVKIDPAAPLAPGSDLFSLYEFNAGVDILVEGADDPGGIISTGYALNTEYNYSFSVTGDTYVAVLYDGGGTVLESIGPVVIAGHPGATDNVVSLINKVDSGVLMTEAHHQGNDTFWVLEGDPWPSIASDLDGDKDVDVNDFLTFGGCFAGALNPPTPGCQNGDADLDGDGDVDTNDFLTFSSCFNGALQRPQSICMPPGF